MTRIFFIFAFVFSQLAIGQSTGTVYGRITDSNVEGEALLFASVSLKDTPIAVQTNFHGNFEIKGVQEGSYVLQMNYLGYEPKEVEIEVKADKVVIVEESLQQLSMQTESLSLTEVSSPVVKVADKSSRR